MTATFNKFNQFVADLANKVHNLGSDVLKVMLSNTAPVATNTVKANIVEIAAGNGYVAGGNQATQISSSQVGGTEILKLNNFVFQGAGGSIGPFRYLILYNSTPIAGPLIAWFDFGQSISVANGDSLIVIFDPVNGILQIA